MLSKGHTFISLFGKDNPQTKELRFIEQIVGPVQSVFSGHIPGQEFNLYIEHLNFKISNSTLKGCLSEIKNIIENWVNLPVGKSFTLEWNLK